MVVTAILHVSDSLRTVIKTSEQVTMATVYFHLYPHCVLLCCADSPGPVLPKWTAAWLQ